MTATALELIPVPGVILRCVGCHAWVIDGVLTHHGLCPLIPPLRTGP
jgi:hypothetical protein